MVGVVGRRARPADRHATCATFIAALAPPATGRRALDELNVVESARRLAGGSASPETPPAPGDLVEAILRLAPAPALGATATRQPDHRWACRLPAFLTPDLLRLKLDQFRADNGLTVLSVGGGTHAYRKPAGLGKPGAELTVAVPPGATWHAAELTVHARSVGGLDSHAKELPAAVALLLDKFWRAVQSHADRRAAPRRRADLAVTLTPIDDELRLSDPVSAQCRDLSAGGFCCAHDGPALTGHLFATFPGGPDTAPWGILCEVARHAPDALTGHAVLGVRFLG